MPTHNGKHQQRLSSTPAAHSEPRPLDPNQRAPRMTIKDLINYRGKICQNRTKKTHIHTLLISGLHTIFSYYVFKRLQLAINSNKIKRNVRQHKRVQSFFTSKKKVFMQLLWLTFPELVLLICTYLVEPKVLQ